MEWPKYVLDGMPKRIKGSSYEAQAEWVAEFRRRRAAFTRKWSSENPEKERARARRRRDENPEKVRASQRRRYAENPEKVRARDRKRREENPEKTLRRDVKKYLKATGISDPPPELVELFTQLRLAKRELKKGTKP